ncbi:MAG: hypothetical protein GY795_29310 [Desulfobacterales bacterium]|nr:hypothetical protein [Desulfobacterales bacterium]
MVTKKEHDITREPLEDIVGDLFVNRHEELELYWDWAASIPNRILNSNALIGRRRTGKTAILIKLFNRLFTEQDRVMPVFITFAHYLHRKRPIDAYEFIREYFTGYVKSYAAFRYRRSDFLEPGVSMEVARKFLEDSNDSIALWWFENYDYVIKDSIPHTALQWVINIPRSVARQNNIPTAMIVDEFQVLTNVHFSQQGFYRDITDSFQWAVDTKWAPILVSGSAVSLLVGEALGGLLSGRVRCNYLAPLTKEYAHDLVFRLGKVAGITVNEELAEAVWQMTGGYPYSIYGLITSPSQAIRKYPSLDALEEVMLFELTNRHGILWQHFNEEFEKYSTVLNASQTTKKIMFWAVKYPDQQIDADRIADELNIDEETVKDALKKLYQVDIVNKIGWTLFEGPGDPMLRRYIEYNYRLEVEKLGPAEAAKDWRKEYRQLQGRVNNFAQHS